MTQTASQGNLISVSELAFRDISASGGRLEVVISGQSFFSGNEAFKKAAEVATCVDELAKHGIEAENVRIRDVTTQVESGLLSKSSSASYRLEVVCQTMDLLGNAVQVVSSLKNSELTRIDWDYSNLETKKREVLDEAVRQAKTSAETIASALGQQLGGVHRLRYDVHGLDNGQQDLSPRRLRMARARASSMDLSESTQGLTLAHRTRIQVQVSADFLVTS